MRKLFIISGGPGKESEVSLSSGKYCFETLRDAGISCEEVVMRQDGTFVYGNEVLSESGVLDLLKKENALVFQVVHGSYGEDGEFVKALEAHSISYIGSTSSVLAQTIDKYATELALKEKGIMTPQSLMIASLEDIATIGDMEYPVIVKPNSEGSSVGVTKANNKEELISMLRTSVPQFGEMLVQKCVVGREFSCGVIEIDGKEIALAPSEVITKEGQLFDYNAKYFTEGLEITPAQVDDTTAKRIQETALLVHTTMGCKDISRTDMILNEDNELVVLEINTVPGMTKASFIPAQITASGYTLKQFVDGMLKKYS